MLTNTLVVSPHTHIYMRKIQQRVSVTIANYRGKAVIDKEKFVDRACVATPSNDRSLPQVEAVENYIL